MSRRRARCSSSSTSSSRPAVGGEEGVPRLPVALDERAADEQRARQLRVDPPVRDLAPRDDRQPVERRPLGRHHRGALALPVRLLVGALDQVVGERLDPARVDPRGGPAPQPRRLDQLGDHHPAGLLARQRRAREDREARAARALVLAPRRVAHADVRQQPGEQRDVDRVRARRASRSGVTPTPFAAWRSWPTRSCHSRTRRWCRNSAWQRLRNWLPDSASCCSRR